MIKILLIVILIPAVGFSQDWFYPDGKMFFTGTERLSGTLRRVEIKHKGKLCYKNVPDSTIAYEAITGNVVAVLAKDSAEAVRRSASFDADEYFVSDQFLLDFDYIRRNLAGRSDILKALGNPNKITVNNKYTFAETFHYSKYDLEVYDGGKMVSILRHGIDKTTPKPIIISDASLLSLGEYIVGVKFRLQNSSKKTFKYVYLTVRAINPVGDLVEEKKVTCVGPLKYGDDGFYSFDNVFYSKVIETISISSIKIIYMDGTVLEVRGVDKVNDFVQ